MLVKIEEYDGDFISQSVMEILETVGFVNSLNIRGYHLSIDPVHKPTPKGMIEDTPSEHKITIERNKFIENMTPTQFRKKDRNGEYSEKVKNDQQILDIAFKEADNINIVREVTVDGSSYVWYKHKVELSYTRPVMEEVESYIKRVFKATADYLVDSVDWS